MVQKNNIIRCDWAGINQPYYEKYHDEEWGVPIHDDSKLFEMIILEGAQAGLSWDTILKKREGYRKAFKNFDPVKVKKMTDLELEELRFNPEIIRNKLKIYSTRQMLQYLLIFKQSLEVLINIFGASLKTPLLLILGTLLMKSQSPQR